jgi:hypothetical protein
MRRAAVLSDCRRYRYVLERAWDDSRPRMAMILLNPSTADETGDDPTLRRGMGFARREGCGALTYLNLFAWRATKPENMRSASDPVGPENDAWLKREAKRADIVVAAWGTGGAHKDRAEDVTRLLAGVELHCLGVTKAGHPRHPLYVRGDAPLVKFPAS